MWNLIWDLKSILENSVQFFLLTIWCVNAPQRIKKIMQTDEFFQLYEVGENHKVWFKKSSIHTS